MTDHELYSNLRHQYDLRLAELEQAKADRNKAGLVERQKYLPELARLKDIIRRASVRFFEDGTSDGETAAAMLRILDEAKSPNDPGPRDAGKTKTL